MSTSRFKRGKPTRQPGKVLHIYSEGKNTEPFYFEEIRNFLGGRAKYRIKNEPVCGVPSTLLKAAKGEIKRLQKDALAAEDEHWLVFDRDEHPCFFQTLKEAGDTQVKVAYSIPCFELWLLFHVVDHAAPDDRHETQKKFSKFCSSYKRSGGKLFDFNSISSGLNDAIDRAHKGRKNRLDEGDEYGAPSTNLDLLLCDLIGDVKLDGSEL